MTPNPLGRDSGGSSLRGGPVNLQDALLCVECEAIYSFSSRCPRCGSRESTPLGSAFDPALPLAVTEVADPVELLRAVRSSRRRRSPEYDTLAIATAKLALLALPLSAAVAEHGARATLLLG